ncbi:MULTISPECIES: ParB/RepB/Spo0J family partition protein [Pseudomonas]|uniref:ParB/RepB/Spo0J family partition protein n=1 Tax=Pseudomonas TaxID=286 RepID=UPI000EF653D8|nr:MULTISPECIES: ParB/RepB/Spo0J family partition protein [Pseudomonas]AYN18986.1 chromosome partitioning protein ParB [Pseudomonas monteilii]MCE1037985.1 ParB/RepB/Spo0J family partition protein [Pseudomonas monteilii]MCL8328830.1 ParB/RepB/Spo0J family partition protein [Pseudomonas juntendi]MDD2061460.1 ParB/RepB/Spo0J family partition protein [Pseudomonas putida]UJW25375.1 ParB/RepB/Spo0J family partition protein [Pseudomonas juntendi]
MKSTDYPGKPSTAMASLRKPTEMPPTTGSRGSRAAMLQQAMGSEQEADTKQLIAQHAQEGQLILKDEWLEEVPVELIDPSPYQPRMFFDQAKLEELAGSIDSVGLGKPITIRPVGERFELIGGECRWRAHKMLGRDKIMAHVKPMSDDMAMLLAITDNLQNELTDYEKAVSYQRYMLKGADKSQRALARRLGVDHTVVNRCLDLIQLPEQIKEILNTKPHLITANYAKKFVEHSKADVNIVHRIVIQMAEKGTGQEAALRMIGQKLAACSGPKPMMTEPRKLQGVGSVRLNGRKLEFKFDKEVDPQKIMDKLAAFLDSIDASEFASQGTRN